MRAVAVRAGRERKDEYVDADAEAVDDGTNREEDDEKGVGSDDTDGIDPIPMFTTGPRTSSDRRYLDSAISRSKLTRPCRN